jgi:hypothetical protein
LVFIEQKPITRDGDKSILASKLGNLSWYYLFNRQFTESKAAAEKGYSLDQQQTWILTNLAHAEMFLGHFEAAIDIHAGHVGNVITQDGNSKKWGDVIANDFAAFRRAGLESSHMAAIERLIGGEIRTDRSRK